MRGPPVETSPADIPMGERGEGRDSCRESSNDDEPADEASLLSLLPLFTTSNKNLEARAPEFTLPYRLPYPLSHSPPLRPSRYSSSLRPHTLVS